MMTARGQRERYQRWVAKPGNRAKCSRDAVRRYRRDPELGARKQRESRARRRDKVNANARAYRARRSEEQKARTREAQKRWVERTGYRAIKQARERAKRRAARKTMSCLTCGDIFLRWRTASYCSDACRNIARKMGDRARVARYCERHPGRRKQSSDKYREQNRDKIIRAQRDWRRSNREKFNAWVRAYRKKLKYDETFTPRGDWQWLVRSRAELSRIKKLLREGIPQRVSESPRKGSTPRSSSLR